MHQVQVRHRVPAQMTTLVAVVLAANLALSSPHPVGGTASWYRWHGGEAAAGPALRSALGPHWRGQVVRVCAGPRCIPVRLTDWCQCLGTRLVDLDSRSFARLAPLRQGILSVTIHPSPRARR